MLMTAIEMKLYRIVLHIIDNYSKKCKIDKVKDNFLEFVSKLSLEELPKVREIFSQTLPLTHENLDKAINQYVNIQNTNLLSTYPEWQQKYTLLMIEMERVCKQSEICKQIFIKPYIQYTNQICYISSTYYVDRNRTIPADIKDR